jgi:endonuclease/exonuclease/phosphatase family metal-dependent hydrolase
VPPARSEEVRDSLRTVTVLSWNLHHGRDRPPDPSLFTLRSRLLGRTEDNGTYLQVNQCLRDEFADLVAGAPWSVCLLQEAPPAWAHTLGERSDAQVLLSLTSRNQLSPLTRLLARHNPDLIGSWEGGSNLTLVRRPWRVVANDRRSLLLNPLRERGLHERRRMSFVRLRAENGDGRHRELCVANLHASHYSRRQAEHEGRRAARAAVAWARGAPLVLGGDFNVRPRNSRLFEELERDFGLAPATDANAIDHALARGLEPIHLPTAWPVRRRELELRWRGGLRRIRLSDHHPVEAAFRLPAPECAIK